MLGLYPSWVRKDQYSGGLLITGFMNEHSHIYSHLLAVLGVRIPWAHILAVHPYARHERLDSRLR